MTTHDSNQDEHIAMCRRLHEAMPQLKTDFEWTLTENVEEGLYYGEAGDLVKISTNNIVYLKDRHATFPDFDSDAMFEVLPQHVTGRTKLHPLQLRAIFIPVTGENGWEAGYAWIGMWQHDARPCCALKRLKLALIERG